MRLWSETDGLTYLWGVQGDRGYWYMASPYSKYPAGQGEAFDKAARAAALLMQKGIRVFSPITHSHPIEKIGGLTASHEEWMAMDWPLVFNSVGVLVLQLAGWDTSIGVSMERAWAQGLGKPVVSLPWPVPRE